MKRITFLMAFFAAGLIVSSCSHNRSPEGNYDPQNPGYEYAPGMYHSIPYEGLSQMEENPNQLNQSGMNMRRPPEGTIARGKLDYYYELENTAEGYEESAALNNPLKATEKTLLNGKKLYLSYCSHCHGNEGNSEGQVMASGKFPKPHFQTFNSPYIQGLPDGKMFHSITYGRNLMGAHGSQLNPTQRWEIVLYIKNVLSKGKQ